MLLMIEINVIKTKKNNSVTFYCSKSLLLLPLDNIQEAPFNSKQQYAKIKGVWIKRGQLYFWQHHN